MSASPSSAGAGPAGPTDTPHTFPSTLGGEPRLTGAAADAYQSFIQKISRGDVGEVAVYGARDDPAYIVAEIGDSFVTSDAQATRLLNLTAGAAKITLTGPTEHDVGRDVLTACRATEGLTIRFACVIDDGDRVVMIFATAEAPGNDHVAIARDTVA